MQRVGSLRKLLLLGVTLACGPCGVSASERFLQQQPVPQEGFTHVPQVQQLEFAQNFELPHHHVDCGGHYAETCAVCPQGQGEMWCNGDCVWVWGMCKSPDSGTGWELFWTRIRNLIHRFVWWWWYVAPMISFHGIGMLIYACVYKNSVVKEFNGISKNEDFNELVARETPLFAVFANIHQCLWAFCCTPVVAAKNFAVAEVTDFWCSCCFMWTMYTPFWFVSVIYHSMSAARLQAKLGHESSCCTEFITSLCCMPCAVGRESIETDVAAFREVKCLFTVKDTYEPTAMEEFVEEAESFRDKLFGKSGKDDRRCCGTS